MPRTTPRQRPRLFAMAVSSGVPAQPELMPRWRADPDTAAATIPGAAGRWGHLAATETSEC